MDETSETSQPNARRPRAWMPRQWRLWQLRPARALAYVLAVDAFAILVTCFAVAVDSDQRFEWIPLGLLIVCAVLHLHVSYPTERIRRDHSHAPHVDLCSIWIFAGALWLNPLLEATLVVAIYAHRWWLVGRWDMSRPTYRTVFTVAMMIIAALTAHGVARITGLHERLHSVALGWPDFIALVVAIVALWAVNTALVAGVILLTRGTRHGVSAIGSAADNGLEFAQLVLGAFTALALAWWPPVVILMVVPVMMLHQLVLMHQLKLAANTDQRTELLNAVAWQEQAKRELTRIRHAHGSLGLFIIDLDHFKDVNDVHGHQVGDEVLRSLSLLLRGTVRRADSVGRYGGEEFAVLLPDVTAVEAATIAERIRERVGELTVPYRAEGQSGSVTGLSVSIGVAVWPDSGSDTVHGLIAAADAAMYRGKRSGRNQVRVAGSAQEP